MSDLIDKLTASKQLPPPRLAREIRVAAGASQAQVAAELGAATNTVSRWETGSRRPSGEVRVAYARLLEDLREVAGA